MKIKRLSKILVSLAVILCNISCDQITKEKVREEISFNEVIDVIEDKFTLTRVENTGAALSLGANLSPVLKTIFLQILPLLALFVMFVYIVRNKNISRLNLIAISFIIGGGFGNIYDRIVYNSVTDFMFIDIGIIRTGIFNMADVSIVVGTLLLLLNFLLPELSNKIYRKQGL